MQAAMIETGVVGVVAGVPPADMCHVHMGL